jgi:RimJ/RimL family protein N-acetyltransferase
MDDLPLYESLRANPVVMAELGGAHHTEDIPRILRNTLNYVESGKGWVFAIIPDPASGDAVGTVSLWESDDDGGKPINEIGWEVLPAFQGRGLASQAVRLVLDRARESGRWDVIHAYPGVSNAASNAICRKMGFEKLEECDIDYSGRILRCNHWRIRLGRSEEK